MIQLHVVRSLCWLDQHMEENLVTPMEYIKASSWRRFDGSWELVLGWDKMKEMGTLLIHETREGGFDHHFLLEGTKKCMKVQDGHNNEN